MTKAEAFKEKIRPAKAQVETVMSERPVFKCSPPFAIFCVSDGGDLADGSLQFICVASEALQFATWLRETFGEETSE